MLIQQSLGKYLNFENRFDPFACDQPIKPSSMQTEVISSFYSGTQISDLVATNGRPGFGSTGNNKTDIHSYSALFTIKNTVWKVKPPPHGGGQVATWLESRKIPSLPAGPGNSIKETKCFQHVLSSSLSAPDAMPSFSTLSRFSSLKVDTDSLLVDFSSSDFDTITLDEP